MKEFPKSTQIYFYCMPDELVSLISYAIELKAKILSEYSNNQKLSFLEINDPIIRKVFLCPDKLTNQVKTYRVTDDKYVIDDTTSPVIELSPSIDRRESLSRGRLYTRSGYAGRDEWISYDASLMQMHKELVNFFRKNILTKEKCFAAYVSKGALEFRGSGKKLVQF